MKSLRMFSLAALTALLAMAFVGASSATAEGLTGLCLSEGEEKRCTIPQIHETSVGKGVFLSSLVTVECNTLFSGEITAKGLEELKPLIVKGKYTYSECKSTSGMACEIKELNGPALLELLRTGHETATVTAKGEALVACNGFVHCVYKNANVKGTAKGALLSSQKNGETSFKEQELQRVSGFLCPTTAKFDLTTTPLEPIYIVNAADILLGFCLPVGTALYKSLTCSQASDDPLHNSTYEFFSI